MIFRYGEIPLDLIFNWLAPQHVMAWHHWSTDEHKRRWWEPEIIRRRIRGEELFMEKFDSATGHYTSLKKSVEDSGFLDPVKLITGIPMDPYMLTRYPSTVIPPAAAPDEILHTHIFGGSRVYVAQKLGYKTVPGLIWDFSSGDMWKEYDVLPEDKILSVFKSGKYRVTPNSEGVPMVIAKEIYYGKEKSLRTGEQKRIRHQIIDHIAKLL